jgi:lysophospholipase L1-like esterase
VSARCTFSSLIVPAFWLGTVFLGLAFPLDAQTPPKPFENGDVICFLGDSITDGGIYCKDIADFYATRYPEKKIKVINCGIGGDTAAGAMGRLGWDVLAHHPTVVAIMLGMNDIGHLNYPSDPPHPIPPEMLAAREKSIETYRAKMKEIVEAIRAQSKARVILITPSPYDEKVQKEAKPPHVGADGALGRCSQIVKELAASHGTELVEFHEPLTKLNLEGQKADPKYTLCGGDRVHPGSPGHLMMAETFLRQQGVLKDAATVTLDANAGTVTAEHAKVGPVTTGDHKWTFEVTENALPYPVNTMEFTPLIFQQAAAFNGETFNVSHLTDGKYRLSVDGVELGVLRKHDLKTEGWSIASSEKAPQMMQAKEVVQLGTDRYAQERIIRIVARMKKRAGPKVNLDDEAVCNAWAEQNATKLKPEDAAKFQADLRQYREAKAHEKEALQKIDELTARIYESNKPKPHVWTLEKVSGKGE